MTLAERLAAFERGYDALTSEDQKKIIFDRFIGSMRYFTGEDGQKEINAERIVAALERALTDARGRSLFLPAKVVETPTTTPRNDYATAR